MPSKKDLYRNYSFDVETFNSISESIVNSDVSVFNPLVIDDFGYTTDTLPNSINLVPLTDIEYAGLDIAVSCRELISQIEENYDLLCTVSAYYPPNGFIDWHTNKNVEMYNAICTYSHNGDSFFEYQNGGDTIRIDDDTGWNVKLTKWSYDTPINHRAVSNTHRITFTFSSKNRTNVDNFIENYLGI